MHCQALRFIGAVSILIVCSGCPSGGHDGSYVIVNNSGGDIHDLTLSTPAGKPLRTWGITPNEHGYIHGGCGYHFVLDWKDSAGMAHHLGVDFTREAGYRCTSDVVVEIQRVRTTWCLTEEMKY